MAENILVGVFAVIVVAAVIIRFLFSKYALRTPSSLRDATSGQIIAWKFENGRSEYVEEQDDKDQDRGEKQA